MVSGGPILYQTNNNVVAKDVSAKHCTNNKVNDLQMFSSAEFESAVEKRINTHPEEVGVIKVVGPPP
jgi:hypothetical protein